METRTYRNYTIIKTDTGGRRMGREVLYSTTDGKFSHPTLKGVKALIDFTLDSNQEEIEALKQRIIASLSK